jgi:hypothetical protein
LKDGWEVLESKRFVIPCLPPSVNAIYQIIFQFRRVEMKPEVGAWKTKAKEYIPKLKPLPDSHLFLLDSVFTYPFFYKNGKLKRFDTANLLKVLCDAVSEKSGFDDKLIKFGSWESYDGEEEQVECILRQVCFKGAVL